jgi:N-acyl-D-amino-acid deacylase
MVHFVGTSGAPTRDDLVRLHVELLSIAGRPVEIESVVARGKAKRRKVTVVVRCSDRKLRVKVELNEQRRVRGYSVSLVDQELRAHGELPARGTPVPELASYDRAVPKLLRRWHIPGAAVAVARNGRMIMARGYGFADGDLGRAVKPESLFRIASLSKPITSAAILGLVQQGKIELDSRAFPLLADLVPASAVADPRLLEITIADLLRHTGGWDRDRGFDPMFLSVRAAQETGAPVPASCSTVIRFMAGRRLDFDPGSDYAYSNFGYCVLGRIVEQLSGRPYEEYVREVVLAPMGITRMHVGKSRAEGRREGEVRYYDFPGAPRVESIFPGETGYHAAPYGGLHIEAMDSHGGWIASSIDMLRFLVSIDGPRPFLEPATIEWMTARPLVARWVGSPTYYGLGWSVRPSGNGADWWHSGSLPGTSGVLVRTEQGLSVAILFNSLPRPKDRSRFDRDVETTLRSAADQVPSWPE